MIRHARRTLFLATLVSVLAFMSLGLAACGSSGGDDSAKSASAASDFPSAQGKTIQELYESQSVNKDEVIAPAAITFDVGNNRYPFGVFTVGKKQITDADVAMYFAKSPTGPVQGPLPARVDSLETKPAYRAKGFDPDEAKVVYVVPKVKFDQAGPWFAVAVIKDGDSYSATRVTSPVVGQFPKVAQVGKKAPVTDTLTKEDVGGDLSKIDTRIPPSTMHDDNLADVLGKKPVVLMFATPALCQSRVCGPVVDVGEQVKDEVGDGVSFIHQEIYVDNDPNKGLRPQLAAYGLQTEPWTFLINKDGVVEKRIEGAVGVEELKADVEQLKKSSGTS